ncbi:MAG: C40 family peptidase [Pseudomonadota bacterium]
MSKACVTAPAAWLFAEPDEKSQTTSQLLYGETLDILEIKPAWLKVQAARDHYVGWLRDYTAEPCNCNGDTQTVQVPLAPIYLTPNIKHKPVAALPLNAAVKASPERFGAKPSFLRLTDGRYIIERHLTPPSAKPNALQIAKQFLGTPYAWGGRTYDGIDCSGLVQMALWATGTPCPRDSGDQWENLGRPLAHEESPQAGDLVFFPGHVGFYAGEETLLHANATHMCTTLDPLADVIAWVAQEHDNPLKGFKRLS